MVSFVGCSILTLNRPIAILFKVELHLRQAVSRSWCSQLVQQDPQKKQHGCLLQQTVAQGLEPKTRQKTPRRRAFQVINMAEAPP